MKVLICITSCNRLSEVKKYIWDYISFCNTNEGFDFLLSLDGTHEDYIKFCDKYQIPLLFSDEREGVGLSKNRVLKQFPEYDYYFFLDDDVELVDVTLFQNCIDILRITNYHHLCGNHEKSKSLEEKVIDFSISHSFTGGGYFTCYTRKGIETVGGFHTLFAKYKRYGHSEHTYRYMHSNLQPSPFVFFKEGFTKFILHSPPAVTNHSISSGNPNEWIEEEQNLINNKSAYFPLQTICPFYFNNKLLGYNAKVAAFLETNKKRYPLTKGKARRIALADHYFLKINTTNSFSEKTMFFLKSMFNYPFNIPFKHCIKTKLFKNAK